jgi:hypothetical protein
MGMRDRDNARSVATTHACASVAPAVHNLAPLRCVVDTTISTQEHLEHMEPSLAFREGGMLYMG